MTKVEKATCEICQDWGAYETYYRILSRPILFFSLLRDAALTSFDSEKTSNAMSVLSITLL